jgi:hypothetical protein
MPTEEQKQQSRRLWQAWALWAFWTSEECVQFLRLLNPQAGWKDLCLSFHLFAQLPNFVLEDLYSRLHGRGGVEACRLPNILHDLSCELEQQMDLDEEWRGRLRLSA